MKYVRYLLYVFLGIAFFASIFLSVKAFDKEDLKGSANVLANTMTCCTACLSLVFSTIAINDTRRLHDNDYERDIFNRWYNNLVISPHLTQIQSFFSMCENQLIEEIDGLNKMRTELVGIEYDNLIKQKIVAPFTNSFTRLHQDLVTDISVIDNDLSENVSEIFIQFQDAFFDILKMKEINTELLIKCSKTYINVHR